MTDKSRSLAEQVRAGDRRALAKAITLVESTREDHREQASSLLEALMPYSGDSIRVGISGAPGAGKSTFIEVFGNHIIEQGHSVAVLAVDPSSAVTGGSILGGVCRESVCETFTCRKNLRRCDAANSRVHADL